MHKRDVRTFYRDGRWHNRIEGRDEVLFSHDSREAAVEEGRQLAEHFHGEHFVTDLPGTNRDAAQAADRESEQIAG